MSEEHLYAKIGRLQLKIEEQDVAYTKLIEVTAGLVGGTIDPVRCLVNLTDRTWIVSPDGLRPERPATINGLPVVVTGKEPELQPQRDLPDATTE